MDGKKKASMAEIKKSITRAASLKHKIDELTELLKVEKAFLEQNVELDQAIFSGTDKVLIFERTTVTLNREELEKWLGGKKIPKQCFKTTVSKTIKIN